MNNKGLLLIGTIMGLFLLGLITVTCLPIVTTALDNMRMTKEKMEMIFIAESTIELLQAFDGNQPQECIFDMDIGTLMDYMGGEEAFRIHLPKDEGDGHYYCILDKREKCQSLWEISVEVGTMGGSKGTSIDIFALLNVSDWNGNAF